MQKQISSKNIMIIICMAAVVIVAAVVMLLSKKEEFFRSVLVYELEGSAVIERADIGTIDAAENLYLESGDRVSVKDESMMRMKLDDDKYITAESNTVFSLEAKGNEQDSKTRISLEQGAITNEIQNPLSKESLYETATPNSIMAVRGTVYRAQLCDDGEGGQDMRLCCFQGTVATTPILADGTYGEEVLVHAGSELTVYSDGAVDGLKDIEFDTLPQQAIQTLNDLVDNGTDIAGITKEELAAILSSYESSDADADKQESESTEIAKDTQKASEADTADSDEKVKDADNTQDSDKKDTDKQTDNSRPTDKNKGNSGNNEGDKDVQKPQTPSPSSGNTPDNSDGVNQDNDNSDQGSGDSQDNKPDNGSGNKPKKPSKKVTYTVTYKYQGSVFATQSVKKGDKATAPMLAPAEEGAWDFDFDKKITADTIIEWK